MAYPSDVRVTLQEINGSSCGSLTQDMSLMPSSNPPQYEQIDPFNMDSVCLFRVGLGGGQFTWQLEIDNSSGSGTCAGYWVFRLSTPADNPVGNYCLLNGASTNCTAGKARVEQN